MGPKNLLDASDDRRRQLYAYRERLLQGTLSREAFENKVFPLMALEGLPVPLMGMDATMQMVTLLGILDDNSMTREAADSACFQMGTRVVLHKLEARPELNGKIGTVVIQLNNSTGRVGVLLDSARCTNHPPVAVKPENLCRIRQESS